MTEKESKELKPKTRIVYDAEIFSRGMVESVSQEGVTILWQNGLTAFTPHKDMKDVSLEYGH